jgi:PPOX class probable F420-dependent enzyme
MAQIHRADSLSTRTSYGVRLARVAAIPPAARALLESDALAHLVTLNPDGRPQVTCIWVGVEGDEIVAGHLFPQQKLRNIERDLRHYLVVHGRARITDGGAPELLRRLAQTYLGPGVDFPPMPDPPPGKVTRITPERFGGVGPWAP